jgi:hypothetical protein
MARTALTPVVLGTGGNNLTTALAALGAATGVQWSNTGREVLYVSVGTTPTVVTEQIGTTVLGQAVTAPTVNLAASTVYTLGPFPAQFNQPSSGTNQLFLDFSVSTNVSVALVQIPGVN